MRKDVTDGTTYDELQLWAQSRGLTAETALEQTLDAFYRKNLEDERIARFFSGVDLGRLKKHQFNFMRHLFSDGKIENYTGQSLYQEHKRLIE